MILFVEIAALLILQTVSVLGLDLELRQESPKLANISDFVKTYGSLNLLYMS